MNSRWKRYPAAGLLVLMAAAMVGIPGWAKQTKLTGPIVVNQGPVIQPETQPVTSYSQSQSVLSIDSSANTSGSVRFEPYNTFPRENDLWNLEARRFVRGLSVVSPQKDCFVYSETLFMPNNRQTMARLFLVPVDASIPSTDAPRLPSEDWVERQPSVDPVEYAARFDATKTTQARQQLLDVGFDRIKDYDFRTFTVVDWSANGQRLLFKMKSGVLHVGLRTSDILVYDRGQGVITIYPEIHRVIRYYWENQGNLPHIERIAWEIQPLGWDVGSDSVVLLKAWAFDKKEKKFLGVWRYDVDAERTELVSLHDYPVPVAANGLLVTYTPPPPDAKPDKNKNDAKETRRKPPPTEDTVNGN